MSVTVERFKLCFIAIGTAVSARLGVLMAPVTVLVALGILDYITGLVAAPYRGEPRSSLKGFRGIAKKVCILLLVALAAALDWLLLYAAQWVGIHTPFTFLQACLTAVWLICNEILSILENMGDIGAPLPPFLKRAVQWVKDSAEDQGKLS